VITSSILARSARELLAAVLDLLAAPHCPGCGESGWTGLCRPCRAHLELRGEPACERCGEALLLPGDRCRADHRLLAGLEWSVAPFRYRGTGGGFVRRLKFARDPRSGFWLARAMADRVGPRLTGPFRRAVLVPVPLHPARQKSRGFDQAAWLAQQVAARTGCGVVQALRRVRPTLPQGDPRVTSRERNVADAFAMVRASMVADRAVLLLDDVLTSGATARACAKLLLQHGAAAVAMVTACRA
jgi:ComF family protein